MWQQILINLMKPIIQQFLENLAKQLGMPSGASAVQDQAAVDKAVEETAKQVVSGNLHMTAPQQQQTAPAHPTTQPPAPAPTGGSKTSKP